MNNEEIDLREVIIKIREGRKTIIKTLVVFFIIGLVIALGSPKEYLSETKLLVETGKGIGGISNLLQQFGGLSGINLAREGEDALTPELYPDIITSTPFLLEVMRMKIKESKNNAPITVEEYLDKYTKPSLPSLFMKYSIGLPGLMISWLKKPDDQKTEKTDQGPIQLTKDEYDIMNELLSRIKIIEGKIRNTYTISVEMQDPLLVAQLNDSIVKSLQRYIIDYRTQKAKNDLDFVLDRHAEAEAKYIIAQEVLATHLDRNKNVILASVLSEEQRLQSEFDLAFNIFNSLSQQLEQSKMKVQENTPVFKIIDPAKVPIKKNRPKRSIIMMVMLITGGLVGIGLVFGRMTLKNINDSKKISADRTDLDK